MSKKARELRILKSWLGVSRSKGNGKIVAEAKNAPDIGLIFAPKQYEFEEGRNYEIISREGQPKKADIISPTTGMNCIFRYEGKKGIHHCFREVRGGWTRTYTDTQLIGKRIREAE